ncbi:MAG: hypothetical protein JWM11_3611, partial [Planctomycetaceae bacterium]|nr:hypothetical protein [Planctomycetaceae bacterium]
LQITANDGAGRTTVQNLSVSVTPVNDNAPVFSSSAQFQVPENSTSVGSVIATDLDSPTQNVTYLITGGADAAKFSLASSGQLQFNSAPDFEAPTDANGNNVYELQVTANDGHGLTTTQNISVTVTNANEAPQLVLGGSDVTWTKKRPPNAITVLPEVTVVGNGDLAGGTLSISMDAKGTKRKLLDTLTIPSTAALGTSSGLVNTSGHLTLQIQLGANVTSASIESFLRGITFSTKGSAMRVLTRSVHLTLSNAAGQSSSVTQTIQVHKKAHRA